MLLGSATKMKMVIPPSKAEGVKESPPILGGDEARKGFGGGKGRV